MRLAVLRGWSSTGSGATRRRLVAPPSSTIWPILFLLAIASVCWIVTVQRMQGMDMGPGTDLGRLGSFVGIWATMMAAMMLPSLAPIARVAARTVSDRRFSAVARTGVFAVGYLLAWVAFGLLAYLLVNCVSSLDLQALAWRRDGRYIAGCVIVIAALYELTPAKRRCLRRCRDSLLLRRRPGVGGSLAMGVEQGAFCVGCSGALMCALFALGVMSIAWTIAIAIAISAQKLLPRTVVPVGVTAALLAALALAVMTVPEQVPWLTMPSST
jgi:predicted metal-binding membrane protein